MSDAKPIPVEKTAVALEHKHTRPLTACHWDQSSRYVFFGAEDHLVHRFEVATQKVVPFTAHDSWVRGMATSLDGETLYTAGYDGRLMFWPASADKPEPIHNIEAHAGWVRTVIVSPDGKLVATCGNDRLVKIWSAADGKNLHTFAGHKSHVYNIAFSHDSATIYSCDHKGLVRSWSLTSGENRELATVKSLHFYDTTFRADIGGARDVSLRTDGKQLALSGITKVTNAFAGVGEIAIGLVDVETAKVDLVLESKDKTNGTMWGVHHHPSGFWIGLSGGRGGGWLYFWKGDVQHEYFKLKLKNDGRGMGVSPDGTQLAVAHADMHLRTYKLA
jgi:WD40 repeat protein